MLIGPVQNALFCLLVRYITFCFVYLSSTRRFVFGYWSGTEHFVLLIGPVQNALCFKSGTLRFVLLIGPVQNALFCFMVMFPNLKLLVPKLGTTGYHCKELHTIARNSRFPEIGTFGSQSWNHRLPLQGTVGSQRLELLVPNLETIGYHCKELPVPKDWNSWLPTLEP